MNDQRNTPIENVVLLRRAAERVLADLACPHPGSVHGACSDCTNYGYLVTCDQEQDLVTGCLTVLAATTEFASCPDAENGTGFCNGKLCPWCVDFDGLRRETRRLAVEIIEARNPGIENDSRWKAEKAERLGTGS